MIRQREHGVDRAHVDDRAGTAAFARALLDHLPRGCLTGEECPLEVHAENAVELLFRQIEKRRVIDNAGVVDEHVDAAVHLERLGDQVVHVELFRDVAVDEIRGATALADLGDNAIAGVVIHVRDDDLGALAGEPHGTSLADALPGARYDRDPVLEQHCFSLLELQPAPRRAASTTAMAETLSRPRTVIDGVTMCAGRAAPSRIGPTATLPETTLSRLKAMFAASRLGMMSRFDLEIRLPFAHEVQHLPHLARRGRVLRAEVRVREQRHLGLDAKAADFSSRELRDLGELLGRRIIGHVRVGDEQRTRGQDHRRERRKAARAGAQTHDLRDVAELREIAADRAADQGVGIAAPQQQPRQHRRAVAHDALGVRGRDAVALDEAVILVGEHGHARIGLGIDDIHVDADFESQPEVGHHAADVVAAPDQNGMRDALGDELLCGLQHVGVITFGKGEALARLVRGDLGGVHDRLHQEARSEDEAAELLAIGMEVGDRSRRHARIHRRFRHGGRDLGNEARIEGLRQDVVRAEEERFRAVGCEHDVGGLALGDAGQRGHGRGLHFRIDRRRADIEGAAKDEWETEDVVDLVRVVRSAGGNDGIVAHGLHVLGHDLGIGIGQCEDEGLRGHGGDHLAAHDAGGREPEEDIGADHDLGEFALLGLLCVDGLVGVHELLAACVDHALDVGDPDVLALRSEHAEEAEAGERRRARARAHDLHLAERFADELEAVENAGRDHDRRAVLVIVEDGDLHARLELALDLEALRCLDVLEIDAAECRLQTGDSLDEGGDLGLCNLDVVDVDAGELLEEDGLAFHDRLRGERPDIAEAEHGRAVRDHADEVAARGIAGDGGRILSNGLAGEGDARRVGESEVVLVGDRLGRVDRDLSRRVRLMVIKRIATQIVIGHSPLPLLRSGSSHVCHRTMAECQCHAYGFERHETYISRGRVFSSRRRSCRVRRGPVGSGRSRRAAGPAAGQLADLAAPRCDRWLGQENPLPLSLQWQGLSARRDRLHEDARRHRAHAV